MIYHMHYLISKWNEKFMLQKQVPNIIVPWYQLLNENNVDDFFLPNGRKYDGWRSLESRIKTGLENHECFHISRMTIEYPVKTKIERLIAEYNKEVRANGKI